MPHCVIRFCLIVLLAWGCSACAARQPQEYGYFYSVGLSPNPVERPEDIVARANNLDQQAIILASLGYFSGKGGFPVNTEIAYSWAYLLSDTGSLEKFFLLKAYFGRVTDLEAYVVLNGEFGSKTQLAADLQQAGIFDVDTVLRTLPAPTKEGQKRIRDLYSRYREYYQQMRAVAQQRVPGMTIYEMQDVLEHYPRPFSRGLSEAEVVLFQVATADQNFPAQPEWLGEDIRDFVQQNMWSTDPLWRRAREGEDLFFARLAGDGLFPNSELLRKAHEGDLPSVRRVAVSYLSGAPGFPRASMLGRAWFQYGADLGDPHCLLASSFAESSYTSAWAQAAIAKESGDARLQEMAAWIQRRAEEEMKPGDMALALEKVEQLRAGIRITGD